MTLALQPAHIPRALVAATVFSPLAGVALANDVKVNLLGAETLLGLSVTLGREAGQQSGNGAPMCPVDQQSRQ